MTTTSSDQSALLAAIRDNLADDAPRLIYADWLDEHGEPERAEFIRVQCYLPVVTKKLDGCFCDDQGRLECGTCQVNRQEWESLRRRERELFRDNVQKWCESLRALAESKQNYGSIDLDPDKSTCTFGVRVVYDAGLRWVDTTYQFSRGFLSHVVCRERDWMSHGKAIVRAACAAVERVEFSDKRPLHFGGKWSWRLAGHGVNDHHDIPKELWWDHLVNGFISHDSESDAVAALSRAAIEWAWK